MFTRAHECVAGGTCERRHQHWVSYGAGTYSNLNQYWSSKQTMAVSHSIVHALIRAVRRCFRWGGGAHKKVGTKRLDKVALALPRGWVSDGTFNFAPLEAKFNSLHNLLSKKQGALTALFMIQQCYM